MMGIWQFIADNQGTLSWLGGGVVVVAGGVWAAFTALPKREPSKSVSVDTGLAAGRDNRGNTTNIHGAPKRSERSGK